MTAGAVSCASGPRIAGPHTAGAGADPVVTPEGVPLFFRSATASERLVALSIDVAMLLVIAFAVALVLGLLGLVSFAMLAIFALRFGWFIWWETRTNGSTPGKRRLHLRVVRADGGPLTTEILIARNLTREIELFLPVMVILAPEVLFGSAGEGIVRLIASLWVLLLLFFPLTNRHRLRVGDLLAGTRVIVNPPQRLLRDLADRTGKEEAALAGGAAGGAEEHRFTREQLDIYGVHELQVLEDLLRKTRAEGADEAIPAVAASIARRIAWTEPIPRSQALAFLRAFYAAQRRHLEQRLLLGERRERKRDRRK